MEMTDQPKMTLGDRMNMLRNKYDFKLEPKSYVILSLDGRAFSKYTRTLKTPFDDKFIKDMDETAVYLCRNIGGAKFAYVQSDEINIFLCDYEKEESQPWFNYRLNKILPIAASMASTRFSQLRCAREIKANPVETYSDELGNVLAKYKNGVEVDKNRTIYDDIRDHKPIEFDCKAFTVPTRNDVFAYMLWRQLDCVRNSILMAGQAYFSPKELNGKKCPEIKQMLLDEWGVNWDHNYTRRQQSGSLIVKHHVTTKNRDTDEIVKRTIWTPENAPEMCTTKGRERMMELIPINPNDITEIQHY